MSFCFFLSGESGLDGTSLLPRSVREEAVRTPGAVLAMREAVVGQAVGTAWVVATGALTNVALLFATFPELVERIAGLSIMGGAVGGGFTDAPMGRVEGEGERFGNWTRWAEFNIYVRVCVGSFSEVFGFFLFKKGGCAIIYSRADGCSSSAIPKLRSRYSRTVRLRLRRR